MNDMTLFLDLILIASGAYCMYTSCRHEAAVQKRSAGAEGEKNLRLRGRADVHRLYDAAACGHGRHDHGVRRLYAAQRPARNALPPVPVAAGDPGRRAGLARLVRHPQFPRQPGVFRHVNENDSAASCRNSRRRLFAYLEVRAAGPCWSFSRA